MKNSLIKNSILITALCFFSCLFLATTDVDAAVGESAVLEGRLEGYNYSFNVDPDFGTACITDKINIELYNQIELGLPPESNTLVVDSGDIVIQDGVATVNLEPYCEKLFGDGSTVYCTVCYSYQCTDYLDYLVFEKIDVVEKVNVAPTEDTTVVYDIDSVTTLDVEDFDIKQATELGSGNEYIADYLMDKDTIITLNDSAADAFVWVDNTVTIHAGEKQSKDSIVLAFMMSSLLADYRSKYEPKSVAGFYTRFNIIELEKTIENFFTDVYNYQGDVENTPIENLISNLSNSTYAVDIMHLISSIPLGVNIKEVYAGSYELSSATYGVGCTLLSDFLSGRVIYLYTYLKNTYFEEKDNKLYLCLDKFISCVSFRSIDNDPAQFVNAVNALFRKIISDIDAAVSSDETLSAYGLSGIKDVARVLDGKGCYWPVERLIIKGAFISLIPDAISSNLTTFAVNYRLSRAKELSFNHVTIIHRNISRSGGIGTGDVENFSLWIYLFILSLLGVCLTRRKKRI